MLCYLPSALRNRLGSCATHRSGSISKVPRIDPKEHRIPMLLLGNGGVGGDRALVVNRIWQEPALV
jgi:hypothetical protein